MAAPAMDRSPLGTGFLCLAEPVAHLTGDAATVGPDGTATFLSPAFHDLPYAAGSVRLQVRFNDRDASGALTTNTTNAVALRLCVD